jgi:hypothetical protein
MKVFNKLILLFAIPLVWSSCKVEQPKNVTETVKNISGTWKIIDVQQNGVDITGSNGLDLSQFSITFQNNSYTLANPLPFIVYQNGTYALNDPQVPTQITFTATGGQPVVSTFNYPIVAGVRNIVIQFSANPGCTDNTYQYTLQKVN